MFMDKSVLDETHPCYVGMYDGALMQPEVRAFVEEADRVLAIGTLMTDFNTGAFTSRLDPARTIAIGQHRVRVGDKTFFNVELGDVLKALDRATHASRLAQNRGRHAWRGDGSGRRQDRRRCALSALGRLPARRTTFWSPRPARLRWGWASPECRRARHFYNQTLWGSIGWATPAAFGAAVAAPDRRVVLLTGDGSHQLTVQEISQFARRGLRPIIFVVNNSGYLIERLLCKDPEIAYNDIAPWRYSLLPQAFGCDGWFSARVETCAELDRALEAAGEAASGVYIEIVTDAYAASALAVKMHEAFKTLYK